MISLAAMAASTKAIFPGSFDPFTRGHVDIVRRALHVFSHVVVGVVSNPDKSTLFSLEERAELIRKEFADCAENVEVHSFSGLLVDFACAHKARVIIRGLRAISDYDYEAQMAIINKNLCEELETLFFIAREANSYVSSSLVRQIAALGGNVSKLVTPNVEQALLSKYSKPNPGT